MDLAERIARRRSQATEDRLVVDWDALNPGVHLPEPVGREALFEALFDAIDPVFDETLPPNVYVWGPPGSGKSAIVSALIPTLKEVLSRHQPVYTATRGGSELSGMRFVYIDARQASSRFRLYRQTLDAIRTGAVPERGIGTEELHEQLREELSVVEGALLAIDHLEESNTPSLEQVADVFGDLEKVSWMGIGRTPPEDLAVAPPSAGVHIPPYSYELVDILTVRATRGLSRNLNHVHARRLAEWADGNAHDALGALLVAAVSATNAGRTRIHAEDINRGIDEIPADGVPLGRLVALSENERTIIRKLLDRPHEDARTIDALADDISAQTDLTSSTVKRLLYELAQNDILSRVQVSPDNRVVGRKPSKVTPNFSRTLFEHLYEPDVGDPQPMSGRP
ncbi:cell division control protein 6 [Halalkaliarchaeum desulfuricum]|uniref:Cell division control protein 6 n=1 Tax=Halalkaliarchaeum desulfuricum TaxID=2055893 RepID=A0A343TGP5_9EURY|nr:AAA family ATPase [Halalkaliarchaeum desulfuricum]AUX08267.1 cell division control protein 6 [Halalkaliarchaeum desulfuricum]